MTDPLAEFDATTFAPHVGSDFIVRVVPPASLTLVEVAEPDEQPRGFEMFSLLFRGPADEFLGQGMQLLGHDALGEFHLFLVPVGQDGIDIVYEAAFNRLASD